MDACRACNGPRPAASVNQEQGAPRGLGREGRKSVTDGLRPNPTGGWRQRHPGSGAGPPRDGPLAKLACGACLGHEVSKRPGQALPQWHAGRHGLRPAVNPPVLGGSCRPLGTFKAGPAPELVGTKQAPRRRCGAQPKPSPARPGPARPSPAHGGKRGRARGRPAPPLAAGLLAARKDGLPALPRARAVRACGPSRAVGSGARREAAGRKQRRAAALGGARPPPRPLLGSRRAARLPPVPNAHTHAQTRPTRPFPRALPVLRRQPAPAIMTSETQYDDKAYDNKMKE
jgi:hypothetical protein